MQSQLTNDEFPESDYRLKITLRIALSSIILLTPFAINNLLKHNYLLAIGPTAVSLLLAVVTWRNRHDNRATLTLYGLVPLLIIFLTLIIKQHGVIAVMWCFPVLISFYCMLDEHKAMLATLMTLAVIIPQIWLILDAELASRATVTLIAVGLFSAISARATASYQQSLKTRAITDPLTGLFNRSLLNVTLEQALGQFRRTGAPMTVILLDLDHFKEINDSYGHGAGDKVLTEVGQLLQSSTRLSDTCFRIGGEEFLCLLYGSDRANGLRLAEALRLKIQTADLLDGETVTASFGVTCLTAGENCEQWCKRTDEFLYRAKRAGRNRVMG